MQFFATRAAFLRRLADVISAWSSDTRDDGPKVTILPGLIGSTIVGSAWLRTKRHVTRAAIIG